MEYYDRTDIAEVERDAFQRGYKEARKETIKEKSMAGKAEKLVDDLFQSFPKEDEETKRPDYCIYRRDKVKEGRVEEIIFTIEIPMDEYINVVRASSYNAGFADGIEKMVDKIDKLTEKEKL